MANRKDQKKTVSLRLTREEIETLAKALVTKEVSLGDTISTATKYPASPSWVSYAIEAEKELAAAKELSHRLEMELIVWQH